MISSPGSQEGTLAVAKARPGHGRGSQGAIPVLILGCHLQHDCKQELTMESQSYRHIIAAPRGAACIRMRELGFIPISALEQFVGYGLQIKTK